MRRSCYQEVEGGLLIDVRVQPRSSREQVDGEVEGRLRVRLSAPPVDDAANDALTRLMARWLGVARGAVSLVAGHKAREKRVRISGNAGALAQRLQALLAD